MFWNVWGFLGIGASLLVAACSASSVKPDFPIVRLDNTDLTVVPPRGLVQTHWYDSQGRVLAEFHLPEGSDGGTPAYPEMYVEKLSAKDSGTSLDDYVRKVVSRHLYGDAKITSQERRIAGVRAVDFVADSQAIADFTDGRSAIALMSHHEMALWRDGSIYRCVLETAPDIDSKYIEVYEEFCSTVQFRN